MNQNYIKLTFGILLLAGILFVASQYFSLQFQLAKNEAVANCLTASGVYEYTDAAKGVRTTAPQKEYYQVCMTDKGYTTIWD